MRALVVYESMFGNTHTVANHIAESLRPEFDPEVVAVEDATADKVIHADLVVVGGPTHARGLSKTTTRAIAFETAEEEDDLQLDPHAEGPGLRAWLDDLGDGGNRAAAAFDTKLRGPAVVTGRASKAIDRRLRKKGFVRIAEPGSFLVDSHHHLRDDEADRARAWGRELVAAHALPH